MFVCVVWLSQMLYVKCLCVLSGYLRCYMLNVCVFCLVISVICYMSNPRCFMLNVCVLSGYLRCHMLNVCVCCLVIPDVIC